MGVPEASDYTSGKINRNEPLSIPKLIRRLSSDAVGFKFRVKPRSGKTSKEDGRATLGLAVHLRRKAWRGSSGMPLPARPLSLVSAMLD
jgi:hypothetical protein